MRSRVAYTIGWCRDGVDQCVEARGVDQPRSDQRGDEVDVLLATGDKLGDAQVVRLETSSPRVAGVVRWKTSTRSLARGKHCGRHF